MYLLFYFAIWRPEWSLQYAQWNKQEQYTEQQWKQTKKEREETLRKTIIVIANGLYQIGVWYNIKISKNKKVHDQFAISHKYK
jgi:hypothetical protein